MGIRYHTLLRFCVFLAFLVDCRAIWIRSEGRELFPRKSRQCSGVRSLGLTQEEVEQSTSDLTCEVWQGKIETRHRDGIPPGVECEATMWCDPTSCSTVCARGTVTIPRWLDQAHRFQHKLSSSLPLCYSSWFGTHNSAITLADGYGNLDPVYQSMFEYIAWLIPAKSATLLRTNDQYLSVTDQLNMGVRMVEIDTHWVDGSLRVAHCGGLHVGALNRLVEALNLVAKILGYDIRWDTETVGCNPSLSSIPSNYQRTLLDALKEIRVWMDHMENQDEFLILYLDDEPDLKQWGVIPLLLRHIEDVFPKDWIFTPAERSMYDSWPSVSHLRDRGFRLLFVSSSDYGEDMEPLIFPRGRAVCNWFEPSLKNIDTKGPECSIHTKKGRRGFQTGSLLRTPSCEIQYGPLNCDFVWMGKNSPILDESTLPRVQGCGLNVPSPDLLTPERASSLVWTWAPGYPPTEIGSLFQNDTCTYISSSDGRWRSASCTDVGDLPHACKLQSSSEVQTIWILEKSASCPETTTFDIPRHPRENVALQRVLAKSGNRGAKINREIISTFYSSYVFVS